MRRGEGFQVCAWSRDRRLQAWLRRFHACPWLWPKLRETARLMPAQSADPVLVLLGHALVPAVPLCLWRVRLVMPAEAGIHRPEAGRGLPPPTPDPGLPPARE